MFTLNCNGRLLVIDKPVVMGIINATPDSFYSGSRSNGTDEILRRAELMLKQGASILDIGGQSTRPGSEKLTADEEAERVIAPVQALHKNFPEAIISIDTYYSGVAAEALDAGASIVNDISAGNMDKEMLPLIVDRQVPYVLMHMKGTPQTMQQQPGYENIISEVLDFFTDRIKQLRETGIRDIIIDPGFGFGKNSAQNFELLNALSVFSILDCPLLLGISRKSTIYKTLGITADEALNGTTVLHTIGLLKGASILRVHDVKEAMEAIALFQACMHPA